MIRLDPDAIKRVKLYPVKCSKCKVNLMIRPTEKLCPVCGGSLPKPVRRWQNPTSCATLNSNRMYIKGWYLYFTFLPFWTSRLTCEILAFPIYKAHIFIYPKVSFHSSCNSFAREHLFLLACTRMTVMDLLAHWGDMSRLYLFPSPGQVRWMEVQRWDSWHFLRWFLSWAWL